MIVKNNVVKDIVDVRDDYVNFLDYMSEKYGKENPNEIYIAKGWIEALNFVLNSMEYKTVKERETVTEESFKIQEMIHCEDGQCAT